MLPCATDNFRRHRSRRLRAGLRDTAAQNPDRPPSVPTAVNTDASHAAPMRLDYVLVGPGIALA